MSAEAAIAFDRLVPLHNGFYKASEHCRPDRFMPHWNIPFPYVEATGGIVEALVNLVAQIDLQRPAGVQLLPFVLGLFKRAVALVGDC